MRKGSSKDKEEVVLTNLMLANGVFTWELLCPISCLNLVVGVLSAKDKQKFTQSFKTTTPRVVTISLNCLEHKISFWLNGRHQPAKEVPIRGEGPFIPFVVLGKERIKVVLNPYTAHPDGNPAFVRYLVRALASMGSFFCVFSGRP